MKFTSKVLLALLVVLIGGLLSSNIILKREYDKVDKTDIYWNYEKVLQQPFKYLKITGGNGTKIAFEQSAKFSVRVLQEWKRWHNGELKAHVNNDTLVINFDFIPSNLYEKSWMKDITAVRIFAPQLLSIDGFNTNFEMFKLKQKSISVNMSGKSVFEVESMIPGMDSINVVQKDSASVEFEMSPDYKSKKEMDSTVNKGVQIHFGDKTIDLGTDLNDIKSDEAMSINSVNATVQGYSILDLGHAQIQSLQLKIADSSAIILSGGALKKMGK
ncbi:MAG: hypothetical protein M3R50_13170 [Bacteroidota bacterium]|nr:hypothetical protein [Bacteroidota bacterium]